MKNEYEIFLAANVYNTISSFITNTIYSQDEVSSQLALTIIVFSVFNADEQNVGIYRMIIMLVVLSV